MRLRTIWTIPAMSLKERFSRTRDWLAQKIGEMLPLRVRYWVTIASLATASMDNKTDMMAMPLSDILEALPRPKNLR